MNGTEFWVYDGINPAQRITDINPVGSSDPSGLTVFNGELYFTANDGVSGRELWKLENENPTASDNIIAFDEDTTYALSKSDFGFSDTDGDELQAVKITQLATVGTLKLDGNDITLNQEIDVADIEAGKLQFVPESDGSGLSYANFQFQVSDGYEYSLNAQTITFNVSAINDTPNISDIAFSISEDASNLTSVGIVDATDVDGDSLSYNITSGNEQGIFTINSNTGEITIANSTQLDFETIPSYDLTVEVNDAITDRSATISVNITNANDAPDIADQEFTLAENASNGVTVGTVDVSDQDGDTLTYSITAGNEQDIFAIDSDTGEITLADNSQLDFETTSSYDLTVEVSDSISGETATVTVKIGDVNDAPEITSTAPNQATQDFAYRYEITVDDPDVDDDLKITATQLPSWLNLSDRGDGTATLTGTPDNSQVGTHTVEIEVEDAAGETDTQNFTLEVKNTNDLPTISGTPDTTVDEDSDYSFTPVVEDLDGDQLSFSIQNQPNWATFDSSTGQLSGTPENADVGITNNIIIQVSDGTETVSLDAFNLEVINTNDTPLFSSEASTQATQDQAYTYNITATDSDTNDVLAIVDIQRPSWLNLVDHGDGTATLTGTPSNQDVGRHSIRLQVEDTAGDTSLQSFDITVANVNDAPIISGVPATRIDEDSSYSFTPTTEDVDGDQLRFQIRNKPTWANFDPATGKLSGKPSNNHVGTTRNITISVSDGTTITQLPVFDLTVDNVNDAPTAINLSNNRIDENAEGAVIGVLTVSDIDNTTFSYQVSDDRFEVVGNQLKLKSGQALNYEQTPNLSLEITATDDGNPPLSVAKTFNLRVGDQIDYEAGDLLAGLEKGLEILQSSIDESLPSANLPLVDDFKAVLPDFLQTISDKLSASISAGEAILESELEALFKEALGEDFSDLKIAVDESLQESTFVIDLSQTYQDGVPLDASLGWDGFGFNIDQGSQGEGRFTYTLSLAFGFSKLHGFYFDTKKTAFKVETDISAEFQGQGNFGPVQVNVRSSDTDPTQLQADLAVQLIDIDNLPQSRYDGDRLTLAELESEYSPSDLFSTGLQTDTNIGLKTSTSLTGDTAYPSFGFDINTQFLAPEFKDGKWVIPEIPKFKFNQFELELGSYITNFSSNLVGEVQKGLKDLPLVGDLSQSLPDFQQVVSDLIETIENKLVLASGNQTFSELEVEALLKESLENLGILDVQANLSLQESQFIITLDKAYKNGVPLDTELGWDGFGFTVDQGSQARGDISYQLSLGFGFNETQGFYFDTENTSLAVDADLALSQQFKSHANVGLVQVDFTNSRSNPTQLSAELDIKLNDLDNIQSSSDDGERLTLEEIQAINSTADLFTTTLKADANIGLKTIASINGDEKYPSFGFDFNADFAEIQYKDEEWTGLENPQYQVNNLSFDLGTYAKDFANSLTSRLQDGLDNIPLLRNMGYQLPNLQTALNRVFAEINTNLQSTFKPGATLKESEIEALFQKSLGGYFGNVNVTSNLGLDGSTFILTLGNDYQKDFSLDGDLGVPGLGLSVGGGSKATGQLGYDLSLGFGIDERDGFYFDTRNTFLGFDLNAGLNNQFNAQAELGLLQLDLHKDPNNRTGVNADFNLRLQDPNQDGRLTVAEISQSNFLDLFSTEMTADANIGLKAETSLQGNSNLPKFNFDLAVDFPQFKYANGTVTSGSFSPNIAFNNMQLDMGTFLSDFAKPIVRSINNVVYPVRGPINQLTQNISPLSSLSPIRDYLDVNRDSKVTLVDIADKMAGTNGSISRQVETLSNALNIIHKVNQELKYSQGTYKIDLGDYRIGNVDATNPNADLTQASQIPTENPNQNPTEAAKNSSVFATLQQLDGLSFPILEPKNAVDLLLGKKDVTLFAYQLPKLKFNLGFESPNIDIFSISVPWPVDKTFGLYANIGAKLGAEVNLGFGFDTYGLYEWKESDFNPRKAYQILDGFYVSDRENADGTGRDIPELEVNADLYVKANLNAVVPVKIPTIKYKKVGRVKVPYPAIETKKAGVEGYAKGGLTGNIKFDLLDGGEDARSGSTGDGKVRFSEIDFRNLSNSYALKGDIDAYLKAEGTAHYVVDSKTWDIIDKRYDLFEFTAGAAYRSRAIDGYIAVGEVFFDANLNGIQDPYEPFSITENDGSFELKIDLEEYDLNQNGVIDHTEGKIVVKNGIDISTNLSLDTPLTSVPGSEVVTPLTTLVAELATQSDPDTAEDSVKLAFGLPEDIDLSSYDPLEAIANGDVNGVDVYAAGIQVQNTIVQNRKLLEAIPEEYEGQIANATITAIASEIQTGQEIDLSQPETLQTIVDSTISATSQLDTEIDSTQLSEVSAIAVQAMAQSNQLIQEAATTDETELNEVATNITRIQKVSMGDLATSISEVTAGTKTIEELATEITPEVIQEKLADAIVNDPTIRPEIVEDDSEDSTLEDTQDSTDTSSNFDTSESSTDRILIGSVVGSGSSSTSEINGFDPSGSIPEIISPVQSEIDKMTANTTEATDGSDMMMGNGVEPMYLLDGHDTLMADDGDNWVNGNQGNDMMEVSAGNDTVYGGQDNDTVFGSAGNDWINGNLGQDFLNGGEDADTLFGGKDDDTLQGGSDNDELFGNAGDDRMEGNDGNDLLHGGQGNDTLSGNDGDDTINGDRGNDLLDGNAGNDMINGAQGDDTLDGGEGADELTGGAGDDLLFGGEAADTLTGGAGDDQFVLTAGNGSDLVTDFKDGQDLLVLDGLTFDQLTIDSAENATFVKFGDEILATLSEVESSLITADDFTSLV